MPGAVPLHSICCHHAFHQWPGTGVPFFMMLWNVCHALIVRTHVHTHAPLWWARVSTCWLQDRQVAGLGSKTLWHPEGRALQEPQRGRKGRRLLWLQPELAFLETVTDFPMRPWLTRSLKSFLSAERDTGWWQPVINSDTNPPYATRGCLTALVGSCSTTRHVTTNQLGPIMKASLMLASTCLFASLGWSWRDEWLLCNARAQPPCRAWGIHALGYICSSHSQMWDEEAPPGPQHHLPPHPQLLSPPCCCSSTNICPVPT